MTCVNEIAPAIDLDLNDFNEIEGIQGTIGIYHLHFGSTWKDIH